MIWREDCDPYEEQRKKRQYAKDLTMQIQYQKQQKEQEEREWEELQRKFQPDDQSPAKWILQGGKVYRDLNGPKPASHRVVSTAPNVKHCFEPSPILETHEQFKPTDTFDNAGAQDALIFERKSPGRALDTSNPLAQHPNFCRFRITDYDQQTDRMREKVQQMEWKQTLDAQLREKESMKIRSVQEDRCKEQEGQNGFSAWKSPYLIAEKETESLDSSNRPKHSQRDPITWKSHLDSTNSLAEDYQSPGKTYDDVSNAKKLQRSGINMPPPPPSSSTYRRPILHSQSPATLHDKTSPLVTQRLQANDKVLEEYRQLLADIRNERTQLRKEKEELRWERDQICEERLMLQLENERVLNLLDKHADRKLNDSIHEFVPIKQCVKTNEAMRKEDSDDLPDSAKQKRQYPCWSPAVAKINVYPSNPLKESTNSRKFSLKKSNGTFKIIDSDATEVRVDRMDSSHLRTKDPCQRSYTPMTMEEFNNQAQLSLIKDSESMRLQRPRQFRLALQSPTYRAPSTQVSFSCGDQHCENNMTEKPLTSESKLVPIADKSNRERVDVTETLLEESVLDGSSRQRPPELLQASGTTDHIKSRLNPDFLQSGERTAHTSIRYNENHPRNHLSESETRAIKSKGFYNLNVDQSVPEEVFRRRSSVGFRSPFPSKSSTKHKSKEKAKHHKEEANKKSSVNPSPIESLKSNIAKREAKIPESSAIDQDASINSKELGFFQVKVFDNES